MKWARRVSFGGWAMGSSAMAAAKLPELTATLRQGREGGLEDVGKEGRRTRFSKPLHNYYERIPVLASLTDPSSSDCLKKK